MSQTFEPVAILRRAHVSFIGWRSRLAIATRLRIHKLSARAEHLGFVAIAAVDAFHLHTFLFLVSLWLLITGLCVELFNGGEW